MRQHASARLTPIACCLVPLFLSGQDLGRISGTEVEAAILAAKQSPPPSSYVLQAHPITTDPYGKPLDPQLLRMVNAERTIYGALYTPFVRVALLARKAFDSYKPFSPAEVSEEARDRLVYVLVHPYQKRDKGLDRFVDAQHVLLLPTGSRDSAEAVHPTWIKSDATLLQNAFGAKVETRSILAAFPPEALKAGRDFVFVYAGPLLDGPQYAGLPPQQRLEIRTEDLARWR